MKTSKAENKFCGSLVGITAALGVTVICIAIFAWLTNSEIIKENHLDYCVMITVLISAFVGSWIAVRKVKQNSLLTCAIAGASYYVLLLMINILFYEGQFAGMIETGLLALGGSMCVFLCGFREKRKPNSHKRVRYSG